MQYAAQKNIRISLFKIIYQIYQFPDLKSSPQMDNPSKSSKTTEYT